MRINPTDGLLAEARFVASPNCDARPEGVRAELLVVHSISLPPGVFTGEAVEHLFTNALDCDSHAYYDRLRNLRVSAHIFIRRNGELVQFVPFHARAWHAGESAWQGRTGCNDFSIGIELEGTVEAPFAAIQMQALATLIAALGVAYPWLDQAPVVGHSDIAPGRKDDPGPHFDWALLEQLLAQD